MALIFNVMGNILNTINFVNLFSDLFANNAQASITLEDMGRIVRTELLTVFRDIAVSDLETMHRNFYSSWLPSITVRTTITANDINSNTGVLHATYNHLINGITLTQLNLDRLDTIYRANSHLFHIDDVVQGVFLFTEMYALLFHMHSSYATLRRIAMDAATLDDPLLLLDTLNARLYTSRAISIINWMMDRASDRRFDSEMLTPARDRWIWIGNLRYHEFYYEDRYQHLNNTPERNRITAAVPAAFHSELAYLEHANVVRPRVEALREKRRVAVRLRFGQRISSDYGLVVFRLQEFDNSMAHREALQRQGSRRDGRSAASFIESKLATLTPPKDLVISSDKPIQRDADPQMTGLIPPVGVDEYRELSEYLYVTTAGKERLDGGAAEIEVANIKNTVPIRVCDHCNSTLPPIVEDVAVVA